MRQHWDISIIYPAFALWSTPEIGVYPRVGAIRLCEVELGTAFEDSPYLGLKITVLDDDPDPDHSGSPCIPRGAVFECVYEGRLPVRIINAPWEKLVGNCPELRPVASADAPRPGLEPGVYWRDSGLARREYHGGGEE